MGKKGDFDILKQVKRFLKMERKIGEDRRGEEWNLRKTSRRGFLSGLAKIAGVGLLVKTLSCVLLPGYGDPHIEQEYNKAGELKISIKSKRGISIPITELSDGEVEIDLRPLLGHEINEFGVKGETYYQPLGNIDFPTEIYSKLKFGQTTKKGNNQKISLEKAYIRAVDCQGHTAKVPLKLPPKKKD